MRAHGHPTFLVAALAALTVVAASAGCSSPSPSSSDGGGSEAGVPGGVGASCMLNTDCNDPLTCDFGKCHQACLRSRDCPSGELCVEVSGYGVCQLPTEASCAASGATCPGALVCAADQVCRVPCSGLSDCLTGQVCSSNACYDPSDLGDASSDSPSSG